MLGGGFRRHIESCRWDNTIDRSFSFRDDVEKRPESSGLGAGSIRICACQTQIRSTKGSRSRIAGFVQKTRLRHRKEDILISSLVSSPMHRPSVLIRRVSSLGWCFPSALITPGGRQTSRSQLYFQLEQTVCRLHEGFPSART